MPRHGQSDTAAPLRVRRDAHELDKGAGQRVRDGVRADADLLHEAEDVFISRHFQHLRQHGELAVQVPVFDSSALFWNPLTHVAVDPCAVCAVGRLKGKVRAAGYNMDLQDLKNKSKVIANMKKGLSDPPPHVDAVPAGSRCPA